ncbi:MAG: hypothetical protein DI535_13830 [Citrobacter freundii]|nr:MAG: hypothetical protein DI535_13830 [Citrobacter freundii]
MTRLQYRQPYHKAVILFTYIFGAFLLKPASSSFAQTIPLKKEYGETMIRLSDALIKRQKTDTADKNSGGIWCEHCQVWHTRAAEAVYPFTVSYLITKNKTYREAALNAASWLFKQQQPNGSWKETPEEWTGTTTDQLLMLLLSFEQLSKELSTTDKQQWLRSMHAAANYLDSVMRPEFASINYVATTTATLAKASFVLNEPAYREKAFMLARRTVSKMDEDGFLNGEGGKSHGNKMGVDLGYNMEMSLWGLTLYAKLNKDNYVLDKVKYGLKNHLYFIYPDGSLDASWGIRSNKWTGYGSATSDGCQVLFSLLADEDPRYATASFRNLQFLRKNFAGDLLGYGLQYAELFNKPPCIYPTFAKAKNLAMAYMFESKESRTLRPMPSDHERWVKYFPTLDVVEVRTKNFMATITGYRYTDQAAGPKGKYMFRPDGGTISHLWAKDHGFMQASSPTIYTRPEPMSFPEAPGVLPLTPRIEYTDTAGYFTNLFEFDSRIAVDSVRQQKYIVNTAGELKDKNWLTGGVGYRMQYEFTDSSMQKNIELIYHDAWPVVRIIEPVVLANGMKVQRQDDKTALLTAGNKRWEFQLMSGSAKLIVGDRPENYWTPYPALKACALVLELPAGKVDQPTKLSYRLRVLN